MGFNGFQYFHAYQGGYMNTVVIFNGLLTDLLQVSEILAFYL